ncbi:hypothetical protein B0H13DRAFT_2252255 [Mycena leptocephala]|nr:hypothetical protein B0H13DRAFT_2252255 [Mycena leptocephala]
MHGREVRVSIVSLCEALSIILRKGFWVIKPSVARLTDSSSRCVRAASVQNGNGPLTSSKKRVEIWRNLGVQRAEKFDNEPNPGKTFSTSPSIEGVEQSKKSIPLRIFLPEFRFGENHLTKKAWRLNLESVNSTQILDVLRRRANERNWVEASEKGAIAAKRPRLVVSESACNRANCIIRSRSSVGRVVGLAVLEASSTQQTPSKNIDARKQLANARAAKAFESICGESVQKGDVKNFDDVQRKIESGSKASYGLDAEQEDKWDKAKSVGLQSLKYLKMLVGAASQASSFVPIPASVANITSTALCLVFDIPESIKGYNDAINLVFGEVSSALSQFQIYQSMDNVDPLLIKRIHQVMVSFVKLCAHVMDKFKRALQQQRDVEGTITLAVVVETRQELAGLLEQYIVFGKTTEETHRASLNEDADRIKTLTKIRDTLGCVEVRLDTKTTQTCTSLASKCSDGTGSWIWTHDAYTTWTAPKDKDTSHVLLVSGPPSSGKTSASALITKRLEEQKGRTSTKKSDDEKNPVQSALKYMAFQIARVDATVQKTLGKVCDAGAFRSSTNLDDLWEGLKIGASGSGATYYLVFDGLENLPDIHAERLLKFIFGPKLAGRVRVLASGTDDKFLNEPAVRSALRIRMDEHNGPDMRIIIDEVLNKEGMLQYAKPNSDQQRAKDKILEKLPQNVQGSYSQLQFGLDNVIRLLSTRTAVKELDQSMSSHEVAIKNLQRSLTVDEISELNELLKWVLFSVEPMNLDQLEAAMFLYSGTESLASLEYIIKNKYSAHVYGKDGVQDYLQKEKDTSGKSSQSKERPTISMTITINNVDQELCGHFLWDLAHKGIRDKFKFDFDAASNALRTAGHQEIGKYLVNWLPYHLDRLRQLEDEEKGTLMPDEKLEIGQNLYKLFQDEGVLRRHRASFEGRGGEEEMEYVRKWLMDSAVVRRLDKRWRDEVQLAQPDEGNGCGGVSEGRSWGVQDAYYWIEEFMGQTRRNANNPQRPQRQRQRKLIRSSSFASDTSEIDWDRVSAWCRAASGCRTRSSTPSGTSAWPWPRSCRAAIPTLSCHSTNAPLKRKNPAGCAIAAWEKHIFARSQTPEAIAQVELALKEAEQEGAMPKPESKDIHYLLACKSEDEDQARESQLGYLKAVLNFPDMVGKRELLKRDLDLLKGIVHAMETATAMPVPSEDHTVDDARFAEGETRGVLLYDRGVAAYTYKVSPKGTEPVSEALRLWKECRDQLSNVGGRNAFVVQQHATEALAKHYFQSMMDGQHLDHIDALSKLAEADSDIWRSDSAGFLGALYALRGEKEQSKAALVRRIKLALQILSDDIPENDSVAFSAMFKTLGQYLDFENAAVALSLKDIMDDDGVDKQQVLDMVTKLAKETIQVAKTQVPDASRQIQRIEAAKAHVDSLVAAAGRESHGEGEQAVPDSKTATAHRLLHSRLSALQQMHTPEINTRAFQWYWGCDGHTPDGKRAKSVKVPRNMVLEICYAEDGGQEVMLEEWKEKLAREWDISLEEVKECQAAMREDDETPVGVIGGAFNAISSLQGVQGSNNLQEPLTNAHT